MICVLSTQVYATTSNWLILKSIAENKQNDRESTNSSCLPLLPVGEDILLGLDLMSYMIGY